MILLKKPGGAFQHPHRVDRLKKLISLCFFISLILLIRPRLSAAEAGAVDTVTGSKAEFCASIQEIIQSGQKKFQSIWGKLDLVSEEYFGKLIPAGLETCFAWLDGRAYHCSSHVGMTETEIGVVYEQYNSALKQCLSDQWQTKEVKINRTNGRRFTTYSSASIPIKIKLGERNRRLRWYIDLYFRH